MTLEEYITQEPPVKGPRVELKADEVQCGEWVGKNPRIRLVTVNHYDYQYVQKEGDACLWVQDEDGNPDRRSVFNF